MTWFGRHPKSCHVQKWLYLCKDAAWTVEWGDWRLTGGTVVSSVQNKTFACGSTLGIYKIASQRSNSMTGYVMYTSLSFFGSSRSGYCCSHL